MSAGLGGSREERLRRLANSRQFRGTVAGSDMHVVLPELERLRRVVADIASDWPVGAEVVSDAIADLEDSRTVNRQLREGLAEAERELSNAKAELDQLREALEIVEDQDGRVDIPELADELRDLRIEVSYLRSECMRVRDQRRAALVLHWPGVNGVCVGCGAASPCPTVEALDGGGQP